MDDNLLFGIPVITAVVSLSLLVLRLTYSKDDDEVWGYTYDKPAIQTPTITQVKYSITLTHQEPDMPTNADSRITELTAAITKCCDTLIKCYPSDVCPIGYGIINVFRNKLRQDNVEALVIQCYDFLRGFRGYMIVANDLASDALRELELVVTTHDGTLGKEEEEQSFEEQAPKVVATEQTATTEKPKRQYYAIHCDKIATNEDVATPGTIVAFAALHNSLWIGHKNHGRTYRYGKLYGRDEKGQHRWLDKDGKLPTKQAASIEGLDIKVTMGPLEIHDSLITESKSELASIIMQKDEELSAHKLQNGQHQNTIAQLQQANAELHQKITDQHEELSDHNEVVTKLRTRLAETIRDFESRGNTINTQVAIIQERDTELANANRDLEAGRETIKQQVEALKWHEQNKFNLTSQLAEQARKIEFLTSKITDHAHRGTRQHEAICRLTSQGFENKSHADALKTELNKLLAAHKRVKGDLMEARKSYTQLAKSVRSLGTVDDGQQLDKSPPVPTQESLRVGSAPSWMLASDRGELTDTPFKFVTGDIKATCKMGPIKDTTTAPTQAEILKAHGLGMCSRILEHYANDGESPVTQATIRLFNHHLYLANSLSEIIQLSYKLANQLQVLVVDKSKLHRILGTEDFKGYMKVVIAADPALSTTKEPPKEEPTRDLTSQESEAECAPLVTDKEKADAAQIEYARTMRSLFPLCKPLETTEAVKEALENGVPRAECSEATILSAQEIAFKKYNIPFRAKSFEIQSPTNTVSPQSLYGFARPLQGAAEIRATLENMPQGDGIQIHPGVLAAVTTNKSWGHIDATTKGKLTLSPAAKILSILPRGYNITSKGDLARVTTKRSLFMTRNINQIIGVVWVKNVFDQEDTQWYGIYNKEVLKCKDTDFALSHVELHHTALDAPTQESLVKLFRDNGIDVLITA